jgi:hypothetical protein
MPRPSTAQPANQPPIPGSSPSAASPVASTQEDAASTPRPPRASMVRPTRGAQNPAISSATEKAATTTARGWPSDSATGVARTAGR